jgi:hypothetical protein
MIMLYDKEFDTEQEAKDYAKEIEETDNGKYKAVVVQELDKWIVEVWRVEEE